MLWTLSVSDLQVVTLGATQLSPFAVVLEDQQDCETIFTDEAGNPQSQWSGYHSYLT
jgi:CRISPR/Cas system-associated endonuclease Cas1